MVDDPEIGELLRKRKEQKAQLVERLRASRPVAVRLKRATERREHLHKRAVGLKEEIDLLKEGLKVRVCERQRDLMKESS